MAFIPYAVGLSLISIVSVLLQFRYARRKTPWIVHLVVFISWVLAFSMCVMLPADMTNEANQGMEIYWRLAYWVSFFFCWAVIPLIQEYYDNGGFTVRDKMINAVKFNLIFYGVAGGIMSIFLLLIFVKSDLTMSELPSFVICISTTFGLFLLTLSLGYGLVEVPRTLWYRANREIRRRLLFFKLGSLHGKATQEQDRLQQTYVLAEKLEKNLAKSKQLEFHGYAIQIVETCPKPDCYQFLNIKPARSIEEVKLIDKIKAKRTEEITRDDLIDLNMLAIRHARALRVAEADFEDIVDELAMLEILLSYSRSNTTDASSSGSTQIEVTPIVYHDSNFQRFVFFCRVHYIPLLLRVAAIVFVLFAGTVIWMELTLAISEIVSPLALLTKWLNDSTSLTKYIAMVLPVSFIVLCTFYSFFVLRISTFYHMHAGGRTGPVSILHNASMMLRLMPPLGYNFFLLTNITENSFFKIIGSMNVIPILGDKFHIYFPSIILLYAIATYFNWFARIKKALGIPHFDYTSDEDHENIMEGKLIYKREKRSREQLAITVDDTVEGTPYFNSKYSVFSNSSKDQSLL